MAIFRTTETSLQKVPETTFAVEKLLERRDLQRLLRADISVLGEELMVIAEEYGEFEESHRRIDLLCIDGDGNLVVVELKRTTDGGHMELQALRYAAMISVMTFEQLVDAHSKMVGGDRAKAEGAIRRFLGEPSGVVEMKSDVRIVLASADFSKELTTSVMWLNKRGLDIKCVRMQPYRLGSDVLLDIQQIIPPPEAEDYEIKIRAQEQEGRQREPARVAIFRRFWAELIERSKPKTKMFENRKGTAQHWLSAAVGRSGFRLDFNLLKEEWRVLCYIDSGENSEERNLAAFKALKSQQQAIETAFGAALTWQELEDARACLISYTMPGGWRTPDADWPALQDQMIDAMIRFERALRLPIRDLKLLDE